MINSKNAMMMLQFTKYKPKVVIKETKTKFIGNKAKCI